MHQARLALLGLVDGLSVALRPFAHRGEDAHRSNYASFSRKRNTLYLHVHYWPGDTVAMGGLMNQVKSARLPATGKEVKFDQDRFRVRLTGLPAKAPDDPVTTFALECDGEPRQETTESVRKERPRLKA